MIEPIIHQIWHPFSSATLPIEWERFSRSWRRWHPQHRHILWQPEESRAFVAQHFPELLPIYDGYTSPMKRVAALRYLLLQQLGGMVVDLDLECLRSTDPLLAGQRAVLSVEPVEHWPESRAESEQPVLSTAFLASEAGHPFWGRVIEELKRSAQLPGLQESTASALLTRCYDAFSDKTSFTLTPPDVFSPVDAHACRDGSAYDVEQWVKETRNAYAVHHWAGTWDRPGLDPLPAPRPYPQGLPARIHHPSWRRHRPGELFDVGPLVSCIMITRGWVEPARWAIDAFRAQSYESRELVVVTTNAEGNVRSYIDTLRDPRIRVLDVLPAGTPLGAQRNAGVAAAQGEFICTWDDDDLYGQDRLAASMSAIATTGATAAFLERIGVWWPARQLYSITPRRPWENTMVAQRKVLARYPEVDRGEDTKVTDALIANHPIVTLDDPNLYTYVVWGTNTWGADHFQRLIIGATYRADKLDYDRALTVLHKHVPILDYLAWLQQRDPRTYDPPVESPAQLSALPARRPGEERHGEARLVRTTSSVAAADPARPLRFLFACERGPGLGHVVPLTQIARPLLDAGHEVHIALPDLTMCHAAFGRLAAHPRFHPWQSPQWNAPLHGMHDPGCYAELLFQAGYLDPRRLTGLVDGWSSIFRQVKPDLLISEHAPTALLAARGHRFTKAVVGSGFFIPARDGSPASDGQVVPLARIEAAEKRVLTTCNSILAAKGLPLLSAVCELTTADHCFLATVPELDYYAERARDPEQAYYGVLEPTTHGTPAPWPRGTEPAVFAYIRADYGPAATALRALRDGAWKVLAVSPGLPQALAVELSSKNMILVTDPVDMREVCDVCDVVVCNGGAGTTGTALYAGKPLVVLPQRLEQLSLARRVQSLAVGMVVLENEIQRLPEAVGRVLTQPSFGEAARAFARRYGFRPGAGVAETIASRCVELARRKEPPPVTGARGKHRKHRRG